VEEISEVKGNLANSQDYYKSDLTRLMGIIANQTDQITKLELERDNKELDFTKTEKWLTAERDARPPEYQEILTDFDLVKEDAQKNGVEAETWKEEYGKVAKKIGEKEVVIHQQGKSL